MGSHAHLVTSWSDSLNWGREITDEHRARKHAGGACAQDDAPARGPAFRPGIGE